MKSNAMDWFRRENQRNSFLPVVFLGEDDSHVINNEIILDVQFGCMMCEKLLLRTTYTISVANLPENRSFQVCLICLNHHTCKECPRLEMYKVKLSCKRLTNKESFVPEVDIFPKCLLNIITWYYTDVPF